MVSRTRVESKQFDDDIARCRFLNVAVVGNFLSAITFSGTSSIYRLAATLVLLVGCCLNGAVFGAEPLIVNLWPDKTPGDVGITGQEESRINQSPILAGPTKPITNVTQPTSRSINPRPTRTLAPRC